MHCSCTRVSYCGNNFKGAVSAIISNNNTRSITCIDDQHRVCKSEDSQSTLFRLTNLPNKLKRDRRSHHNSGYFPPCIKMESASKYNFSTSKSSQHLNTIEVLGIRGMVNSSRRGNI